MEEKYHKGYIFPDEFYKEYTDFNSHKDFIEKAKEEGIEITLTKTKQDIKLVNPPSDVIFDEFVDLFIKKNTNFKSFKDFIKTAKSIYKDPPSILPKSLIRSKIAIAGFLARDNYELKCNICHKNITINKETIIPKCNCSKFSQYIIVKIF